MTDNVGRGLYGSLRARVRAELRDLYHQNKTLRRVRSGLVRRTLTGLFSRVKLSHLILLYLLLLTACVLGEWWLTAYEPCYMPNWGTFDLAPFVKDINSYFIGGQIGILGIVSIAVGVVTLLMQRDDRSSGTTDVRLYYSQSFAYEVVTSGIALLLVLCIQLFWPAQIALHFFQARGTNLTFELGLTVIHAAWLFINLLLFYQFIVTTLRFVEPDARKRMRDRYTADVAMPRDLARRLIQALYLTAPKALFGSDALKKGPTVQFGFGNYFLSQAATEIELRFRQPSRLFDVRMRPLSFVIRRWRSRVQAGQQVRDRRIGGRKWDGELSIPHSFDSEFDGPTAWLLREGPVALRRWERLIIRWSFCFSRREREPRDPITPSDFMGDLTDRLVGQIERAALSGFKTALNELVAYHSFILATQDTVAASGEPLNLAQVGGLFGVDRPDQRWIHLYRRIYFAAVDKLDAEPEFIEHLGYVAQWLVPADARNVSAAVVTALLRVGYYAVVALEAWVTRRTNVQYTPTDQGQPRLAGSDRRTYERILLSFIGAWESTLQSATTAYKWQESDSGTDSNQWMARTRAWPYIQAHLHACAYFFALAVQNEDQMGADHYRDMLLRWLTQFRDELHGDYAFQHPEFLSPELFGLDWPRVAEIAGGFQRGPFAARVSLKTLTGVVLRAAHDDVLVISAAVVISWAVQSGQPTDIGGRQALAILQRTLMADQGSALLPPGAKQIHPFWAALAILIKSSLGSRLDQNSYPATLDSLVDSLITMSERRVVPGRIYSRGGPGGVDKLRPFLLAIMAAYYPANEAAIATWSDWFVSNKQVFNNGDRSIRNLIYSVQTFANLLLPKAADDDFDRALAILSVGADVAEGRDKVRSFLDAFAVRLTTLRQDRLHAAVVDPAKITQIRNALRRELLARGPKMVVFRGFDIRRSTTVAAQARTYTFGTIDKADLVTPSMSDTSLDDLAANTVAIEREHLAGVVWRAFWG